MSAHVLIENTLVQHKMAKNSRMALCWQNQVSKGTNQHYDSVLARIFFYRVGEIILCIGIQLYIVHLNQTLILSKSQDSINTCLLHVVRLSLTRR